MENMEQTMILYMTMNYPSTHEKSMTLNTTSGNLTVCYRTWHLFIVDLPNIYLLKMVISIVFCMFTMGSPQSLSDEKTVIQDGALIRREIFEDRAPRDNMCPERIR